MAGFKKEPRFPAAENVTFAEAGLNSRDMSSASRIVAFRCLDNVSYR
jgi:hypothetical protein